MNREHWKSMLPIVTAFADGKKVEVKLGSSWGEFNSANFCGSPKDYKIAPEPKLRPWKSEEVPLGAHVRYNNKTRETAPYHRAIISMVTEWDVKTPYGQSSLGDLLLSFEHSTDGGKTWLPCGVLEGGE